jgi:NADH dehydrogenase
MRVAIAGGSGFVGRHVARRLLARGHEARVLARGRRSACPEGQVPGNSSMTAVVVPVDLNGEPAALAAALRGCDAVINLVGVKTARGQSFAAAHIEAVERLIAGCAAAGVQRLVHVSVAGVRDDPGRPYLASKWAGEQVVIGSGLAWTIVRPGVIFGAGDDFITNLTAMLRQAAVFPMPARGRSLLQPIAVEDVAEAIVAVLERADTVGQCLDVVGPERLTLRACVLRVAAAIELRTWPLPAPAPLLAPALAVLERWLSAPPLTRAQLGLLCDGVVGEVTQTRMLLGREPVALDGARIAELARPVGPWLGVSLRLVARAEDRRWFAQCGAAAPRLLWFVPLAALLITGLRAVTGDIWRCMTIANLILIPAALLGLGLPWRALLRPRAWHLAFGAGAGLVLYGLGWIAARGLHALAPALMASLAELYAWASLLPTALALPVLVLVVGGEELVWRLGVALPVAGRFGPWWGCLASALAFTLAHLVVGPPVLWVAAFGCGLAWAWIAVKTRSWWPGFVCHYLWDVAVIYGQPY